MRSIRRAGLIGLVVAVAGPVALAWGQPVEGGATQSILEIFWQGIELPTYLIVAGSAAAVALVVEHFLTVRRVSICPVEQVRRARTNIERRRFRECLDEVQKSSTFFARVMAAALKHARHGFDAMHAAALEKSGELSGQMQRKVEYLNIMGNLGPLLGLLGTVWGMIEAFGALGAAGGQAGAGDLATGISKALVNTLLGLALGIVGLGFFGVCRNRIESLTVSATVEALDLLEYFRAAPGGGRPAEQRGGAAAAEVALPQSPREPG